MFALIIIREREAVSPRRRGGKHQWCRRNSGREPGERTGVLRGGALRNRPLLRASLVRFLSRDKK